MSIMPLTPEDRMKGIRDLTSENPTEQEWAKNLREYEARRTREGKPWCFTCAKRDYNKEYHRVLEEAQDLRENRHKPVQEEKLKIKVNLEDYWKGFQKVGDVITKDGTNKYDTHYVKYDIYRCPNGHTLEIKGEIIPYETKTPNRPMPKMQKAEQTA